MISISTPDIFSKSLYNTLYNKVESDNLVNMELSDTEKNSLIRIITKTGSDKYFQESIYVLIRMYQLNHDTNSFLIVPFGGKKLKKGLKFDLNKLPNTLCQILYKYILEYNK